MKVKFYWSTFETDMLEEVQGPLFWIYAEETLSELRDCIEKIENL